jgi:16S rRNA (guanine527-N7)-methyltransferase
LNIEVSPEAARRLDGYAEILRRWSTRLDLVGPAELDRLPARHIGDSLRLLPLVSSLPEGPAVDVGSGAGLPGIPLAIATPDRPWCLVEPRRQRVAFLEEVVRELRLECDVRALTAEQAARTKDLAGVHVVAVARALAPPEQAFGMLTPLVRPGGVAAVLVGKGAVLPPEAEVWRPGIAIVGVASRSSRK